MKTYSNTHTPAHTHTQRERSNMYIQNTQTHTATTKH